jgi:Methylase involved in ubiquinone/menaquinone biosynthesis
VLDLGAGKGDDLLGVASVTPGVELHAAECYLPNIEKLRFAGITVHPIDIERDPLPFGDESLDMVIANQVLEHCKDIWWILHECSRVLRVGGHLAIGIPNLASLHNRLLLMCGRQPTQIQNNSAHVRGYTRSDVLEFLSSGFPNGYKLVEFGGGNFYPLPGRLARPLARMFPTMAWGIFFDLEKKGHYSGGFLKFPIENQLETNFYLGEPK